MQPYLTWIEHVAFLMQTPRPESGAAAVELARLGSPVLYNVSHNTCKVEEHVDGQRKRLFVHRKGATRAFGAYHPDLPERLRRCGQPVLIGGTMGRRLMFSLGRPRAAPVPSVYRVMVRDDV